ncbi:MAG: hypothetical protein ACR2HH_17185 [Chthoniobacterales bacterium]
MKTGIVFDHSRGRALRARHFGGVLASVILLASSVAFAASDEKEIGELYRRGLAGDKVAVVECIDRLEATMQAQPGNQVARVYLGSAYTLRSRDLGIGLEKIRVLKRGLTTMDEAVAAAPNEPKVLLVRALTNSALPAFLGQAASSRRDFARLAEIAENAPSKFQEGDLQVIYFQAGFAAKTRGDRAGARVFFRKSLTHPADPALSEKARAELSAH